MHQQEPDGHLLSGGVITAVEERGGCWPDGLGNKRVGGFKCSAAPTHQPLLLMPMVSAVI
jgi:hypothetical protein